MSAVPPGVRNLVYARANYCCEICGTYGYAGSIHHRRLKQMGGDKRPDTNTASNLILLCGSGSTGCHGQVHANPAASYEAGLMVHQNDSPAETPVRLGIGVRLLDDHGNYNNPQEG